MLVRRFILYSVSLALAASGRADDVGVVEGHLKIVSLKEVELAEDGTPEKVGAANYADYPLVIRSRDRGTERARIAAGPAGEFRAELPPGEYVLDLAHRERKHARATARPFTVHPGERVKVDFEVDAGVR